jgi:kinesin family protein 2/24
VPLSPPSYQVYAGTCNGLVDFCLKGGNAAVIAYGQAGAGKTYTQVDVQNRIGTDLFDALRRDPAYASYSVTLSFFENMGPRNFDLQNERHELTLREDADGAVHVVGLSETSVDDCVALMSRLQACNVLRASAPTFANPESSRSHAICTLTIRRGDSVVGTVRVIDLAGCERRETAHAHDAERFAEMKEINWSLGCLKECINAQLKAERTGTYAVHVPYRRCKLTMLLKDCFTSNAVRTVFIAHISPLTSHTLYSKNTLEYTSRMLDIAEQKVVAAVSGVALPGSWWGGVG